MVLLPHPDRDEDRGDGEAVAGVPVSGSQGPWPQEDPGAPLSRWESGQGAEGGGREQRACQWDPLEQEVDLVPGFRKEPPR